ncbi:MAG: hypothetical protein WBN70_09495, partial [Polyangiales bacterium]
MTSPLENLPPWALETAWVVLAIVAHAGLIAAMPPIPRGDGGIDESVVVSIVDENFVTEPDEEEEPEPVEEAELPEPEPVKPPPRPKTFKAPTDPPKELLEEPPAAAPETPVAFDNIVLTNEGDEPASW